MCFGVDAGGFDAENKLVFEACGEGVISIIRQITPNYYELIETVSTQLFAKTMAFDTKTKNIYLPTAEFDEVPSSDSKYQFPFRREIRPRTFTVLVVRK
jgi:hypothetical protein